MWGVPQGVEGNLFGFWMHCKVVSFQIFDYVRDKEGFVNLLLNHLGTSAIMDFLLQMVAAPSNDQTRIELAQV